MGYIGTVGRLKEEANNELSSGLTYWLYYKGKEDVTQGGVGFLVREKN